MRKQCQRRQRRQRRRQRRQRFVKHLSHQGQAKFKPQCHQSWDNIGIIMIQFEATRSEI